MIFGMGHIYIPLDSPFLRGTKIRNYANSHAVFY